MFHMVIHPCRQFHFLTPVTFDDGIIKNQNLDTLRSCESVKSGSNFNCKEKQEVLPVVGCFIQKTVIGVLGNSLVFMLGIQETE